MTLTLALAGCALASCEQKPAPSAVTPEELKPTDGRVMGNARLDDEKCYAVYNEVARGGFLRLSTGSDALKERLGPPDGVRGSETYWLAVDKHGDCSQYTAYLDGSFSYESASPSVCGLPETLKRRPRGAASATPSAGAGAGTGTGTGASHGAGVAK